jgi:hypothetical protein
MKPSKNPNTPLVVHKKSSTYPTHRNALFSTCIAILAILSLAQGSARAFTNFLVNPGFELGTNGWTIVAPWVWNGPSYAVQNTNAFVNGSGTVHVAVRSGTNAFKEWGYFQTYVTTPGAMQTFPAAPSSTWSADGWASTQIPDNIQTNGAGVGSRVYLQLLFLDATTNYGAPLASYTSSGITIASPVSTWIYQQVTDGSGGTNLLAPSGTAFVRFQMIVAQPAPSGGIYAGGSCYWDDVTLFKTSKPDPEITVQPVATETRTYGQTATFTVVADGLTALSYKWQKDGADISNPNAYGITTATLTLSNVTTAQAGNYTCTVTDLAGPLTSNPGQLIINDPGLISITPALGQTVISGGTANIKVSAAGSTALTYSWQLNGNTLSDNGHFSGTASSNLTVANLTTADAGTYTVLVNGGALQVTNGLKVVSSSEVSSNLLVNSGFEDGVWSAPWENGWTKFNGTALNTSADFYDVLNQQGPVSVWAGTYVAQVYASDADDGFYQNIPVTAGATYHAGGMGYMSHYTPVAGTSFITMQLFFKDSGGNTLQTCAATQFATNATTTVDTWIPFSVTNGTSADLVAPAGAVSATFQVYEFNWTYAGGAGYFDNVYVTQTAAAPAPNFSLSSSVSGNQIHISFPTTTGFSYDVLYSSSLVNPTPSWSPLTTVPGDGTVHSVPDNLGPGTKFYRVKAH